MLKRLIKLLAVAACCSFLGCQQHSDTFHLVVEDVIHSETVDVVVLTVHAPAVGNTPGEDTATVSLKYKDGDTGVNLMPANDGTVGDVRLTAVVSLAAPADAHYGYIQRLFRMDYDHGGTKVSAGGPAIYPVDERTKLKEFYNLSAAAGVYKIGVPVVIGKFDGAPLTLLVSPSSTRNSSVQ